MSASSSPASPKEAPAKAGPPVAPAAVGSATSTAAPSAAPPAASQPSVVAAPARIKPPPEYLTRPDGTAASPPDLPQIGTTAEGMPVYRSFQPSAGALAVMLTPFVRNTHSLEGALPLPAGLKLQRSPDRLGHQIQLRTAPLFAKKMRRTFGYVAEIKLTDGEGCGAPAQLQIVTRVPWRYGSTAAEKECSWTLIRIQAFTSKAMFATPARVGFCILSSPPFIAIWAGYTPVFSWGWLCRASSNHPAAIRRAAKWWAGTCPPWGNGGCTTRIQRPRTLA